ncbi:carbohydrate-binding family 9-like protein [Enhygromyxa salina]|uniref:Carbohydrate-binding domain-containing protein n=1 Tax=Enhygromyxa salina TaxID=215803 RepID=A0A2S9YQ48_9BACT|nr:carbohydrate-binding family 9-like protein [Enhygromyxa salina]PRQ07179.1 hypothetical protein ENSA7_31940 [Enhygromyxa salina]
MPRCLIVAALVLLPACVRRDATPPDRIAQVAAPLAADEDPTFERFSGTIELPLSSMDARKIGPTPLIPARPGADGQTVIVEFETTGLRSATGKLGLLPPRGAARQEVAYDMPGQPDDPRSVWVDVTIEADGAQRFELPAPGPTWHAEWAVVALELRLGRTPMPALVGPRSEMLSDQTRTPGARVILGVVPVEPRPARVQAVRVAGSISLDGVLDEPAWQTAPAILLASRDGEPATEINEQLGGPTSVWFAWDREYLYVAGSLPDPDLYAPHRERDEPLYRDEAFEVFIAGDSSGARYLEHQVSARNVVFDARFPKYREGNEGWDGSWRSAVSLDGELERRGGDRGWTVELAFAWSELCERTKIRCPPKPGQQLRVNVFRLDKPDRNQQVGLALSPTLEPDFHAWRNAAELTLLDHEPEPGEHE